MVTRVRPRVIRPRDGAAKVESKSREISQPPLSGNSDLKAQASVSQQRN
jgi:hypothetical protein